MSADERMRQLRRRAEAGDEEAQVELLRWEERHDPDASSLDVDLVRALQTISVRGPGLDEVAEVVARVALDPRPALHELLLGPTGPQDLRVVVLVAASAERLVVAFAVVRQLSGEAWPALRHPGGAWDEEALARWIATRPGSPPDAAEVVRPRGSAARWASRRARGDSAEPSRGDVLEVRVRLDRAIRGQARNEARQALEELAALEPENEVLHLTTAVDLARSGGPTAADGHAAAAACASQLLVGRPGRAFLEWLRVQHLPAGDPERRAILLRLADRGADLQSDLGQAEGIEVHALVHAFLGDLEVQARRRTEALRWYLAAQRVAPHSHDILVRIRTVARGSRKREVIAEAEATFARAPRPRRSSG